MDNYEASLTLLMSAAFTTSLLAIAIWEMFRPLVRGTGHQSSHGCSGGSVRTQDGGIGCGRGGAGGDDVGARTR
jgi:hypothetical protein